MKGERKRELNFQGLICTFSQPTLGGAGASSYLAGHQVKSPRPQGQGTATPSGTSSGLWSGATPSAHHPAQQRGPQGGLTAQSVRPDFSALGSPGHGWVR